MKKQKKQKKHKARLRMPTPCGCTVDTSCGVCVLSPSSCTEGVLGAFCPSFSNLIFESGVVELAEVIGRGCALAYCEAVCKAKKKACEDDSFDWVSYLESPWNKFFEGKKEFQRWYAWMLYEKAAILGKLDLKDSEDLAAITAMATTNKLFWGKAFRAWFNCQSCFPCCVASGGHKSHKSLKTYLNKIIY